ncbi:XisH family protein [Geminocystis herdmanii]|uniref:XisH family protein n=1 Tax=Geminocystis herdmanii TaxID=669359 RepID=UPI00034ACD7E|nr:XisH family protein [Geminocystis herdmanii]
MRVFNLIKDHWKITHDPLILKFGQYDQIQVDLDAEKILGAEKEDEKIAVEIKSFLSDSAISDFHGALGQFLNYHFVLEQKEPERILFLAVPSYAYESFFQRDLPQAIISRYNLKLVVYDPIEGLFVNG